MNGVGKRCGKQVTDFKDMVKAFHKEGIAVIMDVVYNHLSEYEIGNLKQIDKEYYFRLMKMEILLLKVDAETISKLRD